MRVSLRKRSCLLKDEETEFQGDPSQVIAGSLTVLSIVFGGFCCVFVGLLGVFLKPYFRKMRTFKTVNNSYLMC